MKIDHLQEIVAKFPNLYANQVARELCRTGIDASTRMVKQCVHGQEYGVLFKVNRGRIKARTPCEIAEVKLGRLKSPAHP